MLSVPVCLGGYPHTTYTWIWSSAILLQSVHCKSFHMHECCLNICICCISGRYTRLVHKRKSSCFNWSLTYVMLSFLPAFISFPLFCKSDLSPCFSLCFNVLWWKFSFGSFLSFCGHYLQDLGLDEVHFWFIPGFSLVSRTWFTTNIIGFITICSDAEPL